MDTKELKIDWLYCLKKKLLFSLLSSRRTYGGHLGDHGHYCR